MSSSLCSFKPCRPSWSWAWSCNGPTYMATSDARSVEDPICRHWLRTILVHSFSSRYTILFFSLKILCCDSYANIFFSFWFAYLTKGNGENTEVLNSHRTTGPSTTGGLCIMEEKNFYWSFKNCWRWLLFGEGNFTIPQKIWIKERNLVYGSYFLLSCEFKSRFLMTLFFAYAYTS